MPMIYAEMGGAGRSMRSCCIEGASFGVENVAVIRSREVAAKQGFF